jgi:hypothetical protein
VIAGAGASVAGETGRSPLTRAATRLVTLAEENGTLVVVVCAAAFAFLVRLPTALAADSWMVLLSGREIVQHGLPSHDSITVWAHGHAWVDQQWLAQVAMYSIERIGGIRLVLLAHAALATGGFAAACAIARRRGASALSVTWVGAVGLLALFPEAVTLRSQSFAYPLFVAVLAVLLRDLRHRSSAVFFVFPLLALWANLHGSVVVGAGLASLYGILALRVPGRARAVSLALVPWGCVLASPYVGSLPSYYRWILFDAHFGRFITEWAPTTLRLVTAPVFVLAIGGAWLLGRARGNVRAFEALALLATGGLAFQAQRNMPWFGLAAILILPALLDRVRVPAAQPRRANRILAGFAALAVVVAVAAIGAKSTSWFLQRYPTTVADTAASAAGTSRRVFANESYADWLVWTHPELSGRIAFDARFELLSNPQLVSLFDFRTGLGDWQAAARGYDVLVLSGKDENRAVTSLVGSHEASVLAERGGVVVLGRMRSG